MKWILLALTLCAGCFTTAPKSLEKPLPKPLTETKRALSVAEIENIQRAIELCNDSRHMKLLMMIGDRAQISCAMAKNSKKEKRK